jgi:hypothetical protein
MSALGLYGPGSSPVHQMRAGAKLSTMLAVGARDRSS